MDRLIYKGRTYQLIEISTLMYQIKQEKPYPITHWYWGDSVYEYMGILLDKKFFGLKELENGGGSTENQEEIR